MNSRHYFEGKDALLGTLAYVFDEKYEELMQMMPADMGAMEKLRYLNHELFAMIESSVSLDLLTRLLSTQLLARGEKHLLDRDRTYFRLLRRIISEGQGAGELTKERTVNEIVKAYALWERALVAVLGFGVISALTKSTPSKIHIIIRERVS